MTEPLAAPMIWDADPLSAQLTSLGPRTPALSGTPVESVLVLLRDARGRSGIWECTPGSFDSARNGDTEMMCFIAGAGTITSSEGDVCTIAPGVVLVAADGWRGTWNITQTVRKVYTIWTSEPDQA